MKMCRLTLPVATTLLFAGPVIAQSDEAERMRQIETREAEVSVQMREAEKRLAEAAQRVAELSTERLGQMGNVQRYAFHLSDKPRLGVTIGDDDKISPVEGVAVIGVTPGSAAADSGLRSGDILTLVNSESLSADSSQEANKRLLDFMEGVEEGDKLEIEYLRDGNVGTVEVEPRVVEQNAFAWAPDGQSFSVPDVQVAPRIVERFRFAFSGRHSWGDMELVELTEGLGRYFGTESGLLVISAPKSNAFKLQDGDVIQSIDGRDPSSVNHCMRILASYQPGEKIELKIMRDKRRETLDIEMPDDRSGMLWQEAPQPVRPTVAPVPTRTPHVVERT